MVRPTGRPLPEGGGSSFGSRGATSSLQGGHKTDIVSRIPYAEIRSMTLPPDGNLCVYSEYQCHGEKVSGYDYCLRHILSDKSAPFKLCGFSLSDNQADKSLQGGPKCTRAAPFYSRGDSYCVDHAKSKLADRHRLATKRKPSANVLLDSLTHYKKQKVIPVAGGEAAVDPFNLKEDVENEGLGLSALDAEELQEGPEDTLITDTWVGEGESEGESVDSEGEDSLQHAGVFTAEEVMRTMKDKLVKLQKLYIDQFQRVLYKMRESRRVYLTQLKAEKDAGLINIFDQPKDIQEYERLKAMLHYYSPAGREALLAARHREKRMSLASGSKPHAFPPCQHALTSTTKCSVPCVPMAKFCLKHILEENGQVLYRPCGVVTPADGPCETPVAALFPHSTCIYHTRIPPSNLSPLRDVKTEVKGEMDKEKADQTKLKFNATDAEGTVGCIMEDKTPTATNSNEDRGERETNSNEGRREQETKSNEDRGERETKSNEDGGEEAPMDLNKTGQEEMEIAEDRNLEHEKKLTADETRLSNVVNNEFIENADQSILKENEENKPTTTNTSDILEKGESADGSQHKEEEDNSTVIKDSLCHSQQRDWQAEDPKAGNQEK